MLYNYDHDLFIVSFIYQPFFVIMFSPLINNIIYYCVHALFFSLAAIFIIQTSFELHVRCIYKITYCG